MIFSWRYSTRTWNPLEFGQGYIPFTLCGGRMLYRKILTQKWRVVLWFTYWTHNPETWFRFPAAPYQFFVHHYLLYLLYFTAIPLMCLKFKSFSEQFLKFVSLSAFRSFWQNGDNEPNQSTPQSISQLTSQPISLNGSVCKIITYIKSSINYVLL